jgi:hypothetical protein
MMLELFILALFYGMLGAAVAAYVILFWKAAIAPDHTVPAAPLITLILALLLVIGGTPAQLEQFGVWPLPQAGAVLVLAWLGWALWERTRSVSSCLVAPA